MARQQPLPKAYWRFFIAVFTLPVTWMLISLLFGTAG